MSAGGPGDRMVWDDVILHLHGDEFRAIFPPPGCDEPGIFLLERSWNMIPPVHRRLTTGRDLMHTTLNQTKKMYCKEEILGSGNRSAVKSSHPECPEKVHNH